MTFKTFFYLFYIIPSITATCFNAIIFFAQIRDLSLYGLPGLALKRLGFHLETSVDSVCEHNPCGVELGSSLKTLILYSQDKLNLRIGIAGVSDNPHNDFVLWHTQTDGNGGNYLQIRRDTDTQRTKRFKFTDLFRKLGEQLLPRKKKVFPPPQFRPPYQQDTLNKVNITETTDSLEIDTTDKMDVKKEIVISNEDDMGNCRSMTLRLRPHSGSHTIFPIVKKAVKELKNNLLEGSGFLLIVFGGEIKDLENIDTPLVRSIKFVQECTDPLKTLIIVTGNCPSCGSVKDIPVYALGPRAYDLRCIKLLADVPKGLQQILDGIYCGDN